jgi:phospholipid/cholesterol/gamma-HCH transport system ATP-binding protein
VKPGETIMLFGTAGSGKTVLLKTAIGLMRSDGSPVYLFGQNITPMEEEQLYSLRQRVGVLFQEGALFDSLTVEENVAFPLENRWDQKLPESEVRARVRAVLERVELAHAMEKYPTELSGGMRRRVGIARASVTEPPLMLYDSPTAGLDPITAFRIIALIMQQRDLRNTTSLVVTHRFQDGHLLANYKYDPDGKRPRRTNDVQNSTRFIILKDGRIVFEGLETDLLSSTDPFISKFARRSHRSPGGRA